MAAKRKKARKAKSTKSKVKRAAAKPVAITKPIEAAKPEIGRPTDYTDQLVTVILARITNGESLRKICMSPDMPASSTVYLWLMRHEAFSEKYTRACEDRAHALAEEALEIADDSANDFRASEGGGLFLNAEHVQRSRLRVDTRKWFAARLNPRKYGDKVQAEHSGPGGGAIALSVTSIIVDPKAPAE